MIAKSNNLQSFQLSPFLKIEIDLKVNGKVNHYTIYIPITKIDSVCAADNTVKIKFISPVTISDQLNTKGVSYDLTKDDDNRYWNNLENQLINPVFLLVIMNNLGCYGTTIPTYTGKVFDPFNPDPNNIDIEDIAHHLSNLCRFVGSTFRFYSVAEHSLMISHLVRARKC